MKTCPKCNSITVTGLPNSGNVCNLCGHTWGAQPVKSKTKDPVNHPSHYAEGHSVSVECIMYTRALGFSVGNAFKYVWRAGLKDDFIQDLKKAMWYLEDAINYDVNDANKILAQFIPSSFSSWKYNALYNICVGDYKQSMYILSEIIHTYEHKSTDGGSRLIESPSTDETA